VAGHGDLLVRLSSRAQRGDLPVSLSSRAKRGDLPMGIVLRCWFRGRLPHRFAFALGLLMKAFWTQRFAMTKLALFLILSAAWRSACQFVIASAAWQSACQFVIASEARRSLNGYSFALLV